MKQTTQRIKMAGLLLGTGMILASCSNGSSSFENANPAGNEDVTLADPTDLLSVQYVPNSYSGKAALGVKNYEQIFTSMQFVVGLQSANPSVAPLSNIITTYNNLKTGLPGTNAIASLSPTQMLNVLNLATSFCQNTINNAAARAQLLGSSNVLSSGNIVGGTPATFFADANQRSALASFLANKFWGSNTDSDSERAESESKIASLILDLSSATGNPSMTNVIIGACSAALASGQVIML